MDSTLLSDIINSETLPISIYVELTKLDILLNILYIHYFYLQLTIGKVDRIICSVIYQLHLVLSPSYDDVQKHNVKLLSLNNTLNIYYDIERKQRYLYVKLICTQHYVVNIPRGGVRLLLSCDATILHLLIMLHLNTKCYYMINVKHQTSTCN